jgi:hypothetical protein
MLLDIIPVANEGQGIAFDRTEKDNIIYTIDKEQRVVNKSVCE